MTFSPMILRAHHPGGSSVGMTSKKYKQYQLSTQKSVHNFEMMKLPKDQKLGITKEHVINNVHIVYLDTNSRTQKTGTP